MSYVRRSAGTVVSYSKGNHGGVVVEKKPTPSKQPVQDKNEKQ